MNTTTGRTSETAARIADEALKALNGLLDETICIVPSAKAADLPVKGFISDPSVVAGFVSLVNSEKQFVPISVAEGNPAYLQPILCAILRYGHKIPFLKRKKVGHPLHDTYAV